MISDYKSIMAFNWNFIVMCIREHDDDVIMLYFKAKNQ